MDVNRIEVSVCTSLICPSVLILSHYIYFLAHARAPFNLCITSPSVSANGEAEMFGGMTGFGWRSGYQKVLCVTSNQGAETCYDALESK